MSTMPIPEETRSALIRLFERRRIADVEAVLATIGANSRTTALSRLSVLGYLTSYSHAGRYYTLRGIPDFDADGLWLYEGVGFSTHGMLKDTVPVLVDRSDAGLFHRDLQARLQVRVHNTLLDLLQSERIARELSVAGYLYVSADPGRAIAQLARRREQDQAGVQVTAPASPALVIEVLMEVIHAARIRADPVAVAARLSSRGVAISVEQVEGVFRQYGLPGKKTARSPSTRSRRSG